MKDATVTPRIEGDVAVLEFRGPLTIDGGDVLLKNAVRGHLEKGYKKIVLDLHEVTTIDSSGVGELIAVYTQATNMGAVVKVAGLESVRQTFSITQLISVFDGFNMTEEAVAALK
jgi:anti-sigma B factor antagonist